MKNFLIPLYLLLENSLFYNERGHFMHTSRKNLFLYLPILILFLASFIWVLKAPDHFSWSADLYLRNDDTSVLSQLFYSDNDELSQDNSTDGTGTVTSSPFSGLPDLRSLTLFRFDPTNTQESYRVTHVGFFSKRRSFFHNECRRSESPGFPRQRLLAVKRGRARFHTAKSRQQLFAFC